MKEIEAQAPKLIAIIYAVILFSTITIGVLSQ